MVHHVGLGGEGESLDLVGQVDGRAHGRVGLEMCSMYECMYVCIYVCTVCVNVLYA